MDDEAEVESKINRIAGTFKFRTLEDVTLRSRSDILRMSEVENEAIEWLWQPYIPLGRLTILGGDPGAGKSFITTALAATLSRGESFPGEEEHIREPMVTLMLNAEDDPSDTIKPRLNNLLADQTKIYVSSEEIILDTDGLRAIKEMVKFTGAKLLIVDPIVAFLGPKVDMNRANEVRHIMKGLSRIARSLNIAVLIVRHNRKMGNSGKEVKDIYAGSGSIDFTASVRSELAVHEVRNGNKFLNHIKANSGKRGQSIMYKIVEQPDGSGLFEWGEFALFPNSDGGGKKIISTRFRNEEKIKLWLHDILIQKPDGELAKNIFAKGVLSGYSQTKLEHVKKGLAISVKSGNEWYWKLDPNAPIDFSVDGEV